MGMGDQSVEAGPSSSMEQGGTDRGTCQYVGDGHCLTHGAGAVERFRGGHTFVRGRRGKLVKRYTREYYYICDLARGGRGGKLKQTRLPFPKVKVDKKNDSAEFSFDFLLSKEGQSGTSTDHGESNDEKQIGDEKAD